MINLSIIIPVFNEINNLEKFTSNLFESFKNENVEYIFIDDGSTDGSKDWLKKFITKKHDSELKLISLDTNIGKGNAIHNGIKKSKGKYVLFQDADLELDTNDSLEMYHIITIKDFGFEIDIASQIARKKIDIYEYGISYFARSKLEGKKITWVDGVKSYFYLFKTRFLQNDFSTITSIIFSTSYMIYIGSHFGMGIGKDMVIILFTFVGLFIGLYRKILNSTLILFFCYLGSLFSSGNGKIYTILLGFVIGLYFSKIINTTIKKNKKLTSFFL